MLIKALELDLNSIEQLFHLNHLAPRNMVCRSWPGKYDPSILNAHITSLSSYALALLSVLHVFSCQPCDTGISPAPPFNTCSRMPLYMRQLYPALQGTTRRFWLFLIFKISLMLLVLSHNVEPVYCRRLFRLRIFSGWVSP